MYLRSNSYKHCCLSVHMCICNTFWFRIIEVKSKQKQLYMWRTLASVKPSISLYFAKLSLSSIQTQWIQLQQLSLSGFYFNLIQQTTHPPNPGKVLIETGEELNQNELIQCINGFWKIFTGSRDIYQNVPKSLSPNQTCIFWDILANISGLVAYFSKPIFAMKRFFLKCVHMTKCNQKTSGNIFFDFFCLRERLMPHTNVRYRSENNAPIPERVKDFLLQCQKY